MSPARPVRLLDVNVVLAVVDPGHEFHRTAIEWFERVGRRRFATCPLTENAVLRIASSASYPNRPGDVDTVKAVLDRFCSLAGHKFWSASISLRTVLPDLTGATSRQVTDLYLLALAVENRGVFSTFDRRVRAELIDGGAAAIEVLGD